jgi:hypothetical protein
LKKPLISVNRNSGDDLQHVWAQKSKPDGLVPPPMTVDTHPEVHE